MVFITVFLISKKALTGKILRNKTSSMRGALGRKLESLRKVPALQFVFDNTPERAQRVDLILHQLEEERAENPPVEAAPEPSPAPKKTFKKKSAE